MSTTQHDPVVEDQPTAVADLYPEAEEILAPDAPEEQWHDTRKGGVGGSDASIIMGENRYRELFDLYEDKLGLGIPFEGNYLTRRGHHMEDFLAQEFTRETGIEVVKVGTLASRERPYMRVNPDRMTTEGGIVEFKVHSHHLKDDWSQDEGRVSSEAYWQVVMGMAVTGADHAWVVADVGGELHIIYLERDEYDVADLVAGVDDFWHYNVLAEVPPKPERLSKVKQVYSRANHGEKVVADKDIVTTMVKFREAKKVEKNAKRLIDHYEFQIRQFMENAEVLVDDKGFVIATNKQNGTFKESEFKRNHPDLVERYTDFQPKIDTKLLAASNPELYKKYRSRVIR